MSSTDVTFGPLSGWQKPDCINRSADYDCPNPATREAQIRSGPFQVGVRCCEEKACGERAQTLARVQFDAWIKNVAEDEGL